jgi:formylglycine-generating enzyme required for sulfatase activity
LKPSNANDDSLNRRVFVAGGSFGMGSPEGKGEPAERPQHRITISPFRIQEHEVTNAEYRRFDPNHDRLASANHPVVNVSWYEATAYAAWLGGSLPTEAQWEFAVRGSDGRAYPWGEDAPTCAHANFMECGSALLPVKDGRDQGKTPDQVYDLAGNAWEWCRDWFGDYSAGDRRDPLGPTTGSARIVRGGSFFNVPYDLRGVNRYSSVPEVRNEGLGFRVVWPATTAKD